MNATANFFIPLTSAPSSIACRIQAQPIWTCSVASTEYTIHTSDCTPTILSSVEVSNDYDKRSSINR